MPALLNLYISYRCNQNHAAQVELRYVLEIKRQKILPFYRSLSLESELGGFTGYSNGTALSDMLVRS